MTTKFSNFFKEIEIEAKNDQEASEELEAFTIHFKEQKDLLIKNKMQIIKCIDISNSDGLLSTERVYKLVEEKKFGEITYWSIDGDWMWHKERFRELPSIADLLSIEDETMCSGGCNNTGWQSGENEGFICNVCDRACICKVNRGCLVHTI